MTDSKGMGARGSRGGTLEKEAEPEGVDGWAWYVLDMLEWERIRELEEELLHHLSALDDGRLGRMNRAQHNAFMWERVGRLEGLAAAHRAFLLKPEP